MWCDPPSIPTADIIQPSQTNWSKPLINDKKQLSFVYEPGVRLYDKKKIDIDQDLRITSTTDDVDERLQLRKLCTSDVDHRWSSSSSIEFSSPDSKPSNLYKSYLRRQNEQDSLPIRQKLFSSDDTQDSSPKTNHHIKLFDVNISTNQENNQKRKFDQNLFSNKKFRYSSSSNEQKPTETLSKSNSNENLEYKKHLLLDEELNRQKAKLITTEKQSLPIKIRTNSTERLQKQSMTTIIKNIPMVKKLSSENRKLDIISTEKEGHSIPSQGLLLCPKEEPIKKTKKKKIAPTSTALLDDDPVLDSILFNEIQSVQQQWQQFLILTMEKELHINPSDGKKKSKLNKFNRTNEFLLAYENLYNFEGMKHWYPTSR